MKYLVALLSSNLRELSCCCCCCVCVCVLDYVPIGCGLRNVPFDLDYVEFALDYDADINHVKSRSGRSQYEYNWWNYAISRFCPFYLRVPMWARGIGTIQIFISANHQSTIKTPASTIMWGKISFSPAMNIILSFLPIHLLKWNRSCISTSIFVFSSNIIMLLCDFEFVSRILQRFRRLLCIFRDFEIPSALSMSFSFSVIYKFFSTLMKFLSYIPAISSFKRFLFVFSTNWKLNYAFSTGCCQGCRFW